ncbi:MAG TPA: hypothetical protein VFV27_05615 [Nevskiaceae bacterium]|nr:hypothetical protein [Nevskiaceae bacterium]
MNPPDSPDADRARNRRSVWLGLAHALLAVLILAGFVYVQSQK